MRTQLSWQLQDLLLLALQFCYATFALISSLDDANKWHCVHGQLADDLQAQRDEMARMASRARRADRERHAAQREAAAAAQAAAATQSRLARAQEQRDEAVAGQADALDKVGVCSAKIVIGYMYIYLATALERRKWKGMTSARCEDLGFLNSQTAGSAIVH